MKNELTKVDFHGATLIAVKGDSPAETLVAMKPVVEGMGLDWSYQYRKLNERPVLSKGVAIIAIPSAGGTQEMVALPLNRLNFWLATIQPDRIKNADTRAKVIEYQTECADVLFDHFFAKAMGTDLDRQTNGISRMLSHKVAGMEKDIKLVSGAVAQLADQVRDMVIAYDPRIAAVNFVSQRQLLDQAKVPSKGRRPLNQKFAYHLRAYAIQHGVLPRKCPHSGVWLYPVELADQFMKDHGNGWIADHKAKRLGQGVLRLCDHPHQPTA